MDPRVLVLLSDHLVLQLAQAGLPPANNDFRADNSIDIELDKDGAREIVYGMPYGEWRERRR